MVIENVIGSVFCMFGFYIELEIGDNLVQEVLFIDILVREF